MDEVDFYVAVECFLGTSDLHTDGSLSCLGYTMYHLVLHRYMWRTQLCQPGPSYKNHWPISDVRLRLSFDRIWHMIYHFV